MNLFDYVRVLIRRGWIVVLAVVITSASAYAYSRNQTPEYSASQKALIQPARNDFGLVETLRILLRSYVEYLNTDLRAQEVIERLQLDMTPGELRTNATINSDPTTLIIQIDVEMEDPGTAAESANMWGQLLVEFRNQGNSDLRREDRIDASLLDYPQAGQSKPNTRTNVLAAAILGILLGGAVIFVLEYLEANILRKPDDVERWLDAPILASIPAEARGD
jgi:capsular polysaccharide biosynthesis protein